MSRTAFERALATTLGRHPLLLATLDEQGKLPSWQAAPGGAPPIDWAADGTPVTHADGQRIELASRTGLRVWVRTAAHRSRIFLQMHHACCDGLAAVQFTDDLLTSYHNEVVGQAERVELSALKPELLAHRGELTSDAPAAGLFTAIRDLWITLWLWSWILFSRVAILAAPAGRSANSRAECAADDGSSWAETDARQPILSFATARLDSSILGGLRAAATAANVTLNDIALRDILLALEDWNAARGTQSRGTLRVSVPVNIRDRADAEMPAANRIGYGFVEPAKRDYASREQLLNAISRQTKQIKDWKLALYFLGGLGLAAGLPRLLRRVLSRRKAFATVVVSNLGRIFSQSRLPRRDGKLVAGNLVLERFLGVTPIRPLTRSAILLVEYAGELTVCVRCDPQQFAPEDVQEFLALYVRKLDETAARGD
ncbi:MAG TPA: hypothetical protein VGJ16_03270 [Pirellulales bacterium]